MHDLLTYERIAKKYPEITFIIAHCGGSEYLNIYEAARVAKENNNVYVDVAISFYWERQIEYLVDMVGDKKILFSTDSNLLAPQQNIGRIAFADISDTAKENIFYRNLKRILTECSKVEVNV